jgi:hypothetical protein
MTTGKELKATLGKIEGGELFDIFNLLPDIAGGEAWVAEIKDCARSMADWLDEGRDYDLDDLRDLGGEWSNSECEDYHNNINARVQSLSLWASNDLDAEVAELSSAPMNDGEGFTLTDLNSQYLCSAMRQLWDAVADQAHQNTETGEN